MPTLFLLGCATVLVVATWTVWLLRRRGRAAGPAILHRTGRMAVVVALVVALGVLLAIPEPRYLRALPGVAAWTLVLMGVAWTLVAASTAGRTAPDAGGPGSTGRS